MLLTFFMDSFFVLLDTALDALSGAVTLPVDMINVLASILGYGKTIINAKQFYISVINETDAKTQSL